MSSSQHCQGKMNVINNCNRRIFPSFSFVFFFFFFGRYCPTFERGSSAHPLRESARKSSYGKIKLSGRPFLVKSFRITCSSFIYSRLLTASSSKYQKTLRSLFIQAPKAQNSRTLSSQSLHLRT